MDKPIKRLVPSDISAIPFSLILLAVIFIAYGLFIPWLGFYIDDWYIIWFRRFFGSTAFLDFFSQDRPFLSWIYIIITPLLGDSPVTWQTFGVTTRWLLGLAFWDLLKQIWPGHKPQAMLGALIFSLFPGFQFHWFSVQYSQAYLILAGMLFSIACSLRAARQPQQAMRWLAIGWLPGVYAVISIEYHFGLELFRPALIWLALANPGLSLWQRVKKTSLIWLPNFLPLLAFSIWRIFFFQSFMYKITLLDDLASAPLPTVWKLLGVVGQEFLETCILVWAKLFTPSSYNLLGKTLLITIGIAVFSIGLLFIYLRQVSSKNSNFPFHRQARQAAGMILLGSLMVLFSLIPFKAAGLPVNLSFPWNRFMIITGLGSAIVAVGILSFLPRNWIRAIVAAVLLGVSLASQINSANQFRLAWQDQKEFFWQLSWRIPAMKPNTMLVTNNFQNSQYFSGNSLTAPLNWIYEPDLSSLNIPFQMVLLESTQIDDSHSLQPNEDVRIHYRRWEFSGNTNQSILYFFNSMDCLQILSSTTNSKRMVSNYFNNNLMDAVNISNLDQINPNPNKPLTLPPHLFGPEPSHDWCYYYQKADLARQVKDWDKVLNLYAEAESNGFSEKHDSEMYPKLEALIMTNAWSDAQNLTDDLFNTEPYLKRGLCAVWERGARNNPKPEVSGLLEEMVTKLDCLELDEVVH